MAQNKDAAIKGDRLDRKFIALTVFGIISAILLVLLVNLAVNTKAGIRAYVAGEGYWAKAQKDAVQHLGYYIFTANPEEYAKFREVLKVNLGDRVAREELLKDDFNYQTVVNGFIKGKNHPDDIPNMISIVRRFYWMEDVQSALQIWRTADERISDLIAMGEEIHKDWASEDTQITQAKREVFLGKLEALDQELTALEISFSETMGNLARKVSSGISWASVFFVFTILLVGGYLTIQFHDTAKEWGNTIARSEEKFRMVLDNSRDVLYQMNLRDQSYEFVSPSIKEMMGYTREEFRQGGAEFIMEKVHPDDMERLGKLVDKYDKIEKNTFTPVVEFRMKNKEGNYRWVSNARSLVRDDKGKPKAIVGSVRDITERKEQDDRIKKSLEEKELLLKEIHHRVKNNLAIISSMLELQKDSVGEKTKKLLSASQSRINSIAKVHEKLYQSTSLADISMREYISDIVSEIGNAYKSAKKDIKIEMDVDHLSLEINQAIYCGLVMNELINNAFKHGFNNQDEGRIQVILKEVEKGLKLEVANNGEKLPENYNPMTGETLGMTLVQVLSEKYNGSLEIESNEWTRFSLTFET